MSDGLSLLKRLPPKDVIISVIMTLGSIALFVHVDALEAQIAPAGADLPHHSWAGYSAEMLVAFLEQIGQAGRALYLTAVRWDFGLIAAVSFSLTAIGYFALGTNYGQWRPRDIALLLPIGYGIADLIENLGLMAAISAVEAGAANAMPGLGFATQAKFLFLYAALLFIPAGIYRLIKYVRSEQPQD